MKKNTLIIALSFLCVILFNSEIYAQSPHLSSIEKSKSVTNLSRNSDTTFVQSSSITQAQDFNTTRSNRENRISVTNPNTNSDSISVQSSSITQAQDFNTTRSNRERGDFSTNTNHSNWDVSLTTLRAFQLNKTQNTNSGIFNGNGYGAKVGIQYFWNTFGVELSNGFFSNTVDNKAINEKISASIGESSTSSISTTDGNQTFLMVGPVIRFGEKFIIKASILGGLFINNPVTVSAYAKDGTITVLKVEENNKKYQVGFSGGLLFSYPLSKVFYIGIGTNYFVNKNSVTYTEYGNEPVIHYANVQNLTANLSLTIRIPNCCK